MLHTTMAPHDELLMNLCTCDLRDQRLLAATVANLHEHSSSPKNKSPSLEALESSNRDLLATLAVLQNTVNRSVGKLVRHK